MELVILAEKKEGRYRIRNFYPNENKNHLEVAIGDTVVVPEISPFPFEIFSSVSKFAPGWKPAYLKVEADITQEEWDSMESGSVIYPRFANRKATILEEFRKPFRYARDMLDYFGDALGTYDLTTWVVHEKIRTNDEFKAMTSIIEQANKELSDEFGPYILNISFDEYMLPYMKQLIALDNVSFSMHGTASKDQKLLHELSKSVSFKEFDRFLDETVFNGKDYFNAWFKSCYKDTTIRSQLMNNLGRWLYLDTEVNMNDIGTLFGRELAIDMTVDTLLMRLYDTSDLWLTPHPDPKDALLEDKLGYHYWLSKEGVTLVEPYSYDERLGWLRSLEKFLEGYASLDEIKARLPMANPKLWEAYANYK